MSIKIFTSVSLGPGRLEVFSAVPIPSDTYGDSQMPTKRARLVMANRSLDVDSMRSLIRWSRELDIHLREAIVSQPLPFADFTCMIELRVRLVPEPSAMLILDRLFEIQASLERPPHVKGDFLCFIASRDLMNSKRQLWSVETNLVDGSISKRTFRVRP
jgi:hypothetical protein